MADKRHVLHLPKDCFNTVEISHEYFSPVCESSAAKGYLSSPTEYFSPYATPQTSKKEFLDEKLNDNMFETPKKIFEENENEFSLNDSFNVRCISEMNLIRPNYSNNVRPAIEKLMRMIKMPSSSTPENSRTSKRIFSPNYCSIGKANKDPPIYALTRKRLDTSFSSPKALATVSREHNVESFTLKATLVKEIEPPLPRKVQAPLRYQEFDSFPDDQIVVGSPLYKVCKRVDVIYVSEVHFLLMASNRNRRMRMAALRRRARSNSRDSAFSEFMESDSE
ncbi:uncharacterized protein [Polyergus mexicanus]|uniref:uncharacterized protein n=1 Tax=Polyergus mexicanus TaxID=615972 RepID=UPI0038B4572C